MERINKKEEFEPIHLVLDSKEEVEILNRILCLNVRVPDILSKEEGINYDDIEKFMDELRGLIE